MDWVVGQVVVPVDQVGMGSGVVQAAAPVARAETDQVADHLTAVGNQAAF